MLQRALSCSLRKHWSPGLAKAAKRPAGVGEGRAGEAEGPCRVAQGALPSRL